MWAGHLNRILKKVGKSDGYFKLILEAILRRTQKYIETNTVQWAD